MAYLIDTDVAIHLRDGDAAVMERIATLDDAVILSVVTRVELEGDFSDIQNLEIEVWLS